jgi:hypothetical protein
MLFRGNVFLAERRWTPLIGDRESPGVAGCPELVINFFGDGQAMADEREALPH